MVLSLPTLSYILFAANSLARSMNRNMWFASFHFTYCISGERENSNLRSLTTIFLSSTCRF